MAIEIERKFIVINELYEIMSTECERIEQYYLSAHPQHTVRVRIYGSRGFLTVKGPNSGAQRHEWEYEIPVDEARDMIALCGGLGLSKTRYRVPFGGFVWEVDRYHGRHEGLTVAEVELPSEGTAFDLPPFVGSEVTGQPRYYNSVLAGLAKP